MNRSDLRQLAEIRLIEAQSLVKDGHPDGAYYLCGYAVECGLKACIAKKTRQYDFPDKQVVNESYSHNLNDLVGIAGLRKLHDAEKKADKRFESYWSNVVKWKETSRYERCSLKNAQDFYEAVADRRHGVLRWIRKNW